MRNLEHYALLSGAFLAIGSNADAQIVYTDIDPDLYTDGSFQSLDIDVDGIADFGFYMYFYTSWFDVQYSMVYMQALHSGAAIENAAYAWWIPSTGAIALDAGAAIGSAGNFDMPPGEDLALLAALKSYNPGFSCSSSSFSPHDQLFFGFPGVGDKYVGIRLGEPGNYHYGWIRLSVPYHIVCTVPMGQSFELIAHDYALNLTANASILAGEVAVDYCHPPTPFTPFVGATAAKISWESVAEAEAYLVQYRQTGVATWTEKIISSTKTSKLIKSLNCNTAYEWQVSSICDSGAVQSPPCALQTFTTEACRIGVDEDVLTGITLFPNPVIDALHISAEEGIHSVIILNINGKLMKEQIFGSPEDISMDVADFPVGVYLIQLQTESGTSSDKFVKAE